MNVNKKYTIRLALFLALSMVTFMIVGKLTIVATDSINANVLWVTDDTPKKGDYVNYTLDPNVVDNKNITVTKKVVCVEGDRLVNKGPRFYCNGQAIGTAKAKGRKKQVLKQFVWDGEIPKGMFFLSGEHKDSFDSKYWGFALVGKTTKVIKIL